MPEDPLETSGGDSTTPPPAVAATPGGHTDVAPHTEGSPEEAAAGSTAVAPSIATTPGGHTEVAPHTEGSPEEAAQGSTLTAPSTATSVGSSPGPTAGGLVGAGLDGGEDAAGSTATVTEAALTVQNPAGIADPNLGKVPLEVSASRTGALPEVAATPDPSKYRSVGTS